MYNITSNLIWVCPIISLVCLILLTSINVYKLIRKNFSVKVNCWFCNQWTKVPYKNRNSFECPSCLQYNGFNSDGDYNRTLSAQYDEHLNKTTRTSQTSSKFITTNGLCRICNNNQQLRVFQLANFIPLNEANFDVEIEHFEKQLEKAYKLCDKCEKTLKKTIHGQNKRLGIKLLCLGQKGISLIDLTTCSNGISSKTKRSILKNVLFYTIIFFACLNIVHLLTQFQCFDKSLDTTLPDQMLVYITNLKNMYFSFTERGRIIWNKFLDDFGVMPVLQVIQKHVLTLFDLNFVKEFYVVIELMFKELVDYLNMFINLFSFNVNTDSSILLYFAGTLLQFIWLFVNGVSRKKNIFLLFVWAELLYLESSTFDILNEYTNMLQIASAALIISLMFLKNRPKKIKMQKKRVRTNSPKKECNEILGNISDDEVVDCFNKTPSKAAFNVNTIKPVFHYDTPKYTIQKPFCDNSTAAQKSFSTLGVTTNSIDLDVSLNKLHIGTQAAKKTVFKTPCINPNTVRPKPVLSPAKLQNISPTSWSKNSNSTLSDYNQCLSYGEPNHMSLQSPPNTFFDGLGCQSLFPDSMFNFSQTTPMFSKHISLCCQRYPYTNSLNCNPPFRPLLNNEQLVYLAPNFVQSSNVYELFPSQNLSNTSFDGAYNDKFIQRSGNSFKNYQNSDVLQSDPLEQK